MVDRTRTLQLFNEYDDSVLPAVGNSSARLWTQTHSSQTDRVLIRESLCSTDLVGLMRRDILAIRVKNYYAPDLSRTIGERLIGSRLYGQYVNASLIGRVGRAYFETQANDESRQGYEENAVLWIKELRERCWPNLTPFDKFRLDLDDTWSAGAHIASLNGRKMFAGLARHFIKGAAAERHMDVFQWDAPPDCPEGARFRAQLAMNVYLHLPHEGGELVLWDISLRREEYERRRIPGSYGFRAEMLPEPAAILRPELGELILFISGCVHAVRTIEHGYRITWSCFIGYRDVDDPLVMWS